MAKKKQEIKKRDQVIIDLRSRLKKSLDAESDNRDESVVDIRFENGEQWDEQTRKERETDGRPCPVINKVAATVKQIIGDARQNKLSIKVRPVDDQADPEIANLLTGLIRNIENISNAEAAYDNAFECAVRGSFGYFRICTDYSSNDTFEQDIYIKRIVNPFSVYYDPSAVEPDFSDARWCIVTEKMSKEEFEATYPGKSSSQEFELGTGENDSDWFDDETVTIAEYWVREPENKKLYLLSDGRTVDAEEADPLMEQLSAIGITVKSERTSTCNKVYCYKATGSEIIEDRKEWAGSYIPIIPVLGEEVWIEGKRVLRSATRWARDPQVLYNWARANAIETLAMAPKQPWIGTPANFEGFEDQWAIAHRRPMAYLEANPDPTTGQMPQRQIGSITDTGALNEARQSSDDIKATTGYFDASLGAQSNETSGRAIIARERQSDTSTFVFTDNLKRALNHAGRCLVEIIPKIYDTERVVRLLNVDGSEGWARINIEDPMSNRKINDVSVGKYDVVVDVGPAYSTKRLEVADGMIRLAQSAPAALPVILPRLAKNLDWPEADEISKELEAIFKPQQPQQTPEEQMDMQKKQLDIEGKTLVNAQRKNDIMQDAENQQQMMYQIASQAVADTLRSLGIV